MNTVLSSPISFSKKKILIIAPHADDEVIGCGALPLYISKHSKKEKPNSMHIAYATSGFNGVSDNYMQKKRFLFCC